MQTGKSRDLNAAIRQLTQALRNDRWLGENNLEESEGYLLDGHSKR
jgi:hypothetical protein